MRGKCPASRYSGVMSVLDDDLDESASRGIAAQNDLEERIRMGRLPVGEKLPSQRALATQYGVAKSTMQVIIQSLSTKGLIRTEPGRGTFVAPRHAADFVASGELDADRSDAAQDFTSLSAAESAVLDDDASRQRAELVGFVFLHVRDLFAGASYVDVHEESRERLVIEWVGGPDVRRVAAELTAHEAKDDGSRWPGVPGLRLVRLGWDNADFVWIPDLTRRLELRRRPD